jgi:N6-L-threonylcarbamoyladenine synthase
MTDESTSGSRSGAEGARHRANAGGPGIPGRSERVRVLGIETSCDETAAAVVDDGRFVASSVVSSQVDLHARFGGGVPEIASRAHVELVGPVVADALGEAGIELSGVDAVAACHGPGLAGALLVGVSAAKALALVADVPYVGVNHLEAHLYAAWLEEPELTPPLAVLIASGGHTLVVIVEDHGRYRVVGQTVDDAAGEAFDKVARFLGLGYPGGPAIDRLAREGVPDAIAFPRAMAGETDFSFSGLKTAVVQHVRRLPQPLDEGASTTADVAASFQAAVVDQLVDKLVAAADAADAPTLVIGGGVAANSALRARVQEVAVASGRRAFLPPSELCTDNAAMIAAAAWWRLRADGPTPLDTGVDPGLALPSTG